MSKVLAMRLAAMADVARGPQPIVDVSGWADGLQRAADALLEQSRASTHEHDWEIIKKGGEPVGLACTCGETRGVWQTRVS